MKLSVILPFHSNNKLLEEAIYSCIKALPNNSELILLNTSQQKLILRGAATNTYVIDVPRFKYIEALSVGISQAKGEFIALMNSDDLVVESRFDQQLSKIASDKADLIICGIQKFKGNGRKVYPLLGEIGGVNFRSEYLLLGSYGADATWLFNAKWAKQVDLFSSDGDSSDWTTALRVFPESKVSYIPERLYLYRMHDGQITRKNPETHTTLETNWMRLNSKLKLPELCSADIRQMTHPEPFSTKAIQITNIEFWFKEYLALLGSSATEVQELIDRRLILLSMGSPKAALRNLKLSLLLQMTSEFFWNFTKPRKKAFE